MIPASLAVNNFRLLRLLCLGRAAQPCNFIAFFGLTSVCLQFRITSADSFCWEQHAAKTTNCRDNRDQRTRRRGTWQMKRLRRVTFRQRGRREERDEEEEEEEDKSAPSLCCLSSPTLKKHSSYLAESLHTANEHNLHGRRRHGFTHGAYGVRWRHSNKTKL